MKNTSPIQCSTRIGVFIALVTLPAWADDPRMNQIQVVGTHNSYHVRPAAFNYKPNGGPIKDIFGLNYSHAPLDEQLARGVRSFELDLNHTAEGFRVFHHPMVDTSSTCATFADCLGTVRLWSESHPDHVPISFLLELKDESVSLHRDLLPFDAAALEQIDSVIRTVFAPDKLFTPDDLRGSAATLPEAIETHGWPEISRVRGKVFFILHESGGIRDIYTAGHPALEGRAMFVESDEGAPHATFFIRNNPFDEQIPELVRAGYLVRTRADSGLSEEIKHGTGGREAALASGAQIISTDFPPGEADPETGYVVELPGAVSARCNPVSKPSDCAAASLESIPIEKTAQTLSAPH